MTGVLSGPLPPNLLRLHLPARLKAELLRLAHAAAPQECCGLVTGRLTGDAAAAEHLHPSTNLSSRPDREFEIDPALMFRVARESRIDGRVMLGHYHSHPAGPAMPSAADRARAWTAGHVWLIAAPGGTPELTAHLAVRDDKEIILRPLTISG